MARRVPHKSSGKGKRAQQRRRRNLGLIKALGHPRSIQPIAQRCIVKMKYSEVITTDALFGHYAMNLNSVWDPNRTGIGHQPYGFDTFASLYNRYRVIACGYRVQVGLGSTTVPVSLTAIPGNEQIIAGSASEVRENPRSKYIIQNPGADSKVIRYKSYIPSLVGRTRAQYMADDRYQSPVNSSPNELCILNLAIGGGADTLTAGAGIQVLLEYTVEFFDIKHLSQS